MALETNLVSYWKLDGNSNDNKGSNNGSDTNVSYSTSYGHINQGGTFNGSSSVIDAGANSSLNLASGAFSLACWCYPKSTAGAPVMVAKRDSVSPNVGFLLGYSVVTSQKFYFQNKQSSGPTATAVESNAHAINNWYFVVATVDGSGNYALYINGSSENPSSGAISGANSSDFVIGAIYPNASQSFNGYLDEVGVWSRAITSTEVTSLYNSGVGMTFNGTSFVVPTTVYTLTATVGSLALTGYATTLHKVMTLVAAVGNFVLTGFAATLKSIPFPWVAQSKNSSTWTDESKNSSTWSDESKNASTWTAEDKSQ